MEQLRKAAAWQAGLASPEEGLAIAGESIGEDSRGELRSEERGCGDGDGVRMIESVSVMQEDPLEDKLGRVMFEEDRQGYIMHVPTYVWQSNNYLSPEAFFKNDPSEID